MEPSDVALLVRARHFGRTGRARAAREAAGLSLRDVAEILGVTDIASVSRWERGENRPRRDVSVRWARLVDEIETELAALDPDGHGKEPGA